MKRTSELTCSTCGEEKTRKEMRARPSRRFAKICISCSLKKIRAWNTREDVKKQQREYGKQRGRNKNGWTKEDFRNTWEKQRGLCSICSCPLVENCSKFSDRKYTACADHDHVMEKIRGILCKGCNLGLGHFQDDVSRLLKAVEYLNYHRGVQDRSVGEDVSCQGYPAGRPGVSG